MKKYIFLLFLIITKLSFSQEKQSEIVINPHYSLQFPASDMAKDYGISSGVGFDFLKFTIESININSFVFIMQNANGLFRKLSNFTPNFLQNLITFFINFLYFSLLFLLRFLYRF